MKRPLFSSPLEAETAFYAAYERADAHAMRLVWDSTDDIECIHPLGNRLRGDQVHQGWREIFAKADPVAFHLSERRSFEQGDLAVHLLLQNVLFTDTTVEPLCVHATNVYRRHENGWSMVLHHASPAPFGTGTGIGARATRGMH